MKFNSVGIVMALVASSAFASDFKSAETACGFGEQNADVAKAEAAVTAQAECGGAGALPVIRVSDWDLSNFTDSESGHECTKAEATFSCR